MSEQALKDAQLDQAQKELVTYKTIVRSMSGKIAAQKQCLEEYLDANTNLRSGNLLLEDDIKNLNTQHTSLIERIKVLEAENAEFKKGLEN